MTSDLCIICQARGLYLSRAPTAQKAAGWGPMLTKPVHCYSGPSMNSLHTQLELTSKKS